MIPSESAGSFHSLNSVFGTTEFLFNEVQIIKIFFTSHAFGVKSENLSFFPEVL